MLDDNLSLFTWTDFLINLFLFRIPLNHITYERAKARLISAIAHVCACHGPYIDSCRPRFFQDFSQLRHRRSAGHDIVYDGNVLWHLSVDDKRPSHILVPLLVFEIGLAFGGARALYQIEYERDVEPLGNGPCYLERLIVAALTQPLGMERYRDDQLRA